MFLVEVFVEDLIKVFVEFHQKVEVLNEDLNEVFNEELFYGTALRIVCLNGLCTHAQYQISRYSNLRLQ